jgi:carboxylesterase
MSSPLGVLIVHGFTGSRATMEAIIPRAETLGLPWRLPHLRGHWTKSEDLMGVTYDDLLADADAALTELRGVAERVAVVGLSVGGVLALNLAAERPADVESLAVLVPALRYVSKLAPFSAIVARLIKITAADPANAFTDKSLTARSSNYTTFPTATFVSVYGAGRRVEALLPRVTAPMLIIGARQDKVIQPRVAQIAHDRAGAAQKELVWFERSGHEMLLDCEADAVADRVGQFLKQRAELRLQFDPSRAAP